MKRASTFLIVTILCAFSGLLFADTWYVDGQNGNDAWDGRFPYWVGGNQGPVQNLEPAVMQANHHDIIVIMEGTYRGQYNTAQHIFYEIDQKRLTLRAPTGSGEVILQLYKPIDFQQYPDPATGAIFSTIVFEQDPQNSQIDYEAIQINNQSAVYFSGCTFRNFTTNHYTIPMIAVMNDAQPRFVDCAFMDNHGYDFLIQTRYHSSLTVTDSLFTGNIGENFTCLSAMGSSAINISGSDITANTSHAHFTGIDMQMQASLTMTDCSIDNNYSLATQPHSAYGNYAFGMAENPISMNIQSSTIEDNYSFSSMNYGAQAQEIYGIRIEDYCDVSIQDTVIRGQENNYGDCGGVFFKAYQPESTLKMKNCDITENTGRQGAGIWCEAEGTVNLDGCRIVGNLFDDYDSSGIYSQGGNNVMLTASHCVISGNKRGGVVFWTNNAPVTLSHCTIANNDDHGVVTNNGLLENCIIYGNTGGPGYQVEQHGTTTLNYCDIQYGWTGPGTGNIDVDPLFAGNGDYHLQSTAGRYENGAWVIDPVMSPCVDAGDPSDWPGSEPYGSGGRVNMGAYGGTEQASLTDVCTGQLVSDTNHDCDVNFADFAKMAQQWLLSTKPALF